jgi:hypothetical protein
VLAGAVDREGHLLLERAPGDDRSLPQADAEEPHAVAVAVDEHQKHVGLGCNGCGDPSGQRHHGHGSAVAQQEQVRRAVPLGADHETQYRLDDRPTCPDKAWRPLSRAICRPP